MHKGIRTFLILIVLILLVFTGCNRTSPRQEYDYTSTPPEIETTTPDPSTTADTSLFISDTFTLTTFNESTHLDLSQDTSFNYGCIYACPTLDLNAGEIITLLLESDCIINTTWDGNYSTKKPASEIWIGWTEVLSFDSMMLTKPSDISHYNQGKAVKMVLPANNTGNYKVLVLNHDSNQSHSINYNMIRGNADPPSNWIPSDTPSVTLPRSPSNPEMMKLFVTPSDPTVKQAVQDILSNQISFNDFDALRDWVSNHVSYRYDIETHGAIDYWQLPSETLDLHTGDCEDYAILLCNLLRSYGVPSDHVYVAVGDTKDGSSRHAYLIEKYYVGVWRIIEPQAGAVLGWVISDLLVASSYDIQYCFNDQSYITGLPTLPQGVYEIQIPASLYPMGRGAWVIFERNMATGQQIQATVEWISSLGGSSEIINPWDINIYDPSGNIIFTWSGKNLRHDFSYTVMTYGAYKVEILKRDALPRYIRLTIDPVDWE